MPDTRSGRMPDKMTPYEINDQLAQAMARAEEYAEANGGELSEQLGAELDKLEMDRAEKIGNICRYIKDLDAQANAIGREADALRRREAAKVAKVSRLEEYLAAMLQVGERYEDATTSLVCSPSYTTEIDDVKLIPAEYMRVTPEQYIPETKAPDKNAIKAIIRAGGSVPGARVETHKQLKLK